MRRTAKGRVDGRRWLVGLLGCVALVATSGCASSPSATLRRAADSVARQDGPGAEQEAQRALQQARSADDRASAYYLRALARLQQGHRVGARADLQAAAHQRPDRRLGARIEAQSANLDFEEGFYASAAARYAACVDLLPARSPTDRVLFQYAAALQRCGRFQDGEAVYRRLVRDYPDSSLAAQAARKADWHASFFTVQCGAFNDAETAQRSASSLRTRGYTARVVRAPGTAALPWVIHCGQFARYADALRLQSSIRSVQADAFIVP